MPRRNLTTIVYVGVLSMICFSQVDHGLYAARMRQIMNHIHDDGLYQADRRDLFEAAARAMADTVDENTQFITAEQKREFEQSLDQEFGGIGAVLESFEGRPRIRHVLYDQPAARAGLLPGDVVVAVDGVDTKEFERLGDFTNAVKGKPGEPVTLTIERKGTDESLEFTVTRAIIEIESVKGYVRRADGTWDFAIPDAPNIAYIRIDGNFGSKTYEELTEALETVHEKKFAGLILDVRNNPGGRLDAAEQICNLFLPADRVILTTRDRKGRIRETYRSDGSGPYQEIPLAVVINKHSASASEIVAGCLKDNGRAIVVGERTFGKGTVQRLFAVDGGRSTLKLTTASFWTPSERQIHRSRDNGGDEREGADESAEWGIEPNDGFEVVIDDRQIGRLLRHFDRLDFAAIDGDAALPDDPIAPDPPPTDSSLPDDSDDGDAKETPGEETSDDKPADADNPFADIQLERAIEAVKQLIAEPQVKQAA